MDLSASGNKRGRRIRILLWVGVLCTMLAAGLLVGYLSVPKPTVSTGPHVELIYLNAKLGGGILITYPNKRMVFVDPGSENCADELISYLGQKKAENLTVFICDTEESTFTAMDSIVDTFSVSQVIIPENAESNKRWENTLVRIHERGIQTIEVSCGDSVVLAENSVMQILSPIFSEDARDRVHALAGRLVCGSVSFMFASKLTLNEEVALVESEEMLASNVLHASTKSINSTCLEFLSQVKPEFCVVSDGPGGRRASTTLLQRVDPLNTGAELLQSTEKSSTIMRTDGIEIDVRR